MTPNRTEIDMYAVVCKAEFEEVKKMLCRLDKLLRGDGGPGALVRLDRLEQSRVRQSQWFWFVAGVVGPLVGGAAWRFVFGG